jgi:hypothetical protein
MNEKDGVDAPGGWNVERYEYTGHSKLIARYVSTHTGAEVHIIPYDNYELPGRTNCHRITLTKGDSIEVIAEGLEVEHADEAELVAVKTMKDISNS